MSRFFIALLPFALLIESVGTRDSWAKTGPLEPIYVSPADVVWKDAPSAGPGAKIVVLEGDMAKAEPFTARISVPAGLEIAPHTHPTTERVTIISGTLHLGHGAKLDRSKTMAFPAGSFIVMPPGMPMFAFCEEETVIQLNGVGPWGIFYLNPEDDPLRPASE